MGCYKNTLSWLGLASPTFTNQRKSNLWTTYWSFSLTKGTLNRLGGGYTPELFRMLLSTYMCVDLYNVY